MKAKMNEKIKLLRESNGLTQAEMAEKLEISQAAYGAMERGETKILSENLDIILQKFEMDLLDFLAIGENGVICVISKNKNIGVRKNVGHIVINANNENAIVYGGSSADLKQEVGKLQNQVTSQEKVMQELQKTLSELTQVIARLKD